MRIAKWIIVGIVTAALVFGSFQSLLIKREIKELRGEGEEAVSMPGVQSLDSSLGFSRVAIKPERDYDPEKPFYCATGGATIYGDLEGKTLIGVSNFEYDPAQYGLYRIDFTTREVLWELHGGTYGPLCLHPDGDRFLIYKSAKPENESWGIAERKVSDGSLIRGLSATILGPIGHSGMTWGSQAVYDPHDPDKIWIADPENHVIIRTDWNGNVDWQFGEYGVPGSDDTHLNRPSSISLIKGSYAYTHGVAADWNNHRVLLVNTLVPTIELKLPFPYPQAAYIGGGTNIAVYSGMSAQNPYGVFIIPCHTWPRPMWHYPSPVDTVVGHPSLPYHAIVAWGENMLIELDLTSPDRWQKGCPKAAGLFSNQAAYASIPIYSPPIVDWFNTNKNIVIVPSQAGKMEIEVARLAQKIGNVENLSGWTGDWDTIDEITLVAGVATSYHMSAPFNFGRIKVTLDADGTVEGWVNLAP